MYNISKELKEKIINQESLTKEELEEFFKYVIYKVNMITTYKEKLNENLSKEYTALCSEVMFSHNIDSKKLEINNHYFCIAHISHNDYLCDLTETNYQYRLLTDDVYNQYVAYIKEKYHE